MTTYWIKVRYRSGTEAYLTYADHLLRTLAVIALEGSGAAVVLADGVTQATEGVH